MDDSFYEMTYSDTTGRKLHVARLASDRANFTLFMRKVSQLDRVPLLLRSADAIDTIPDERVTATFLTHLCARLMDLTVRFKAVSVLQVGWRRRMVQRRLQELEENKGQV